MDERIGSGSVWNRAFSVTGACREISVKEAAPGGCVRRSPPADFGSGADSFSTCLREVLADEILLQTMELVYYRREMHNIRRERNYPQQRRVFMRKSQVVPIALLSSLIFAFSASAGEWKKDQWLLLISSADKQVDELKSKVEGKTAVVYGKYDGYSEKMSKPSFKLTHCVVDGQGFYFIGS